TLSRGAPCRTQLGARGHGYESHSARLEPNLDSEAVTILIDIESDDAETPPSGSPLRVEIRDVGLADAKATVVGRADAALRPLGRHLATVSIDVAHLPRHTTIWAHVDVDRDGRVSAGDYITTQSFPVPTGPDPRARISVHRI